MSDETTPGGEIREGQRIAKVMARAGLCSRREAETWIASGRVSVNGRPLDSPAYNVSAADNVRVDGMPLASPERTRLFLFHKPRGLVTTARDPQGRPTIFDALPPSLPRVVAVGRLDINTEGLLLLTNDGGLARVLELPATGWMRRYRVRAHGAIDQASLDRLRDGVAIDGVNYLGIEAKLDRVQGSNAWITLGLREGKNREIKKVLEYLGLAVNRLIRISFGPFELGDLEPGGLAEVRTRVLREQLGAKLARQAGADFDAPLVERAQPPADPGRSEGSQPERGSRGGEGRGRIRDEQRARDHKRARGPSRDEAPRRAPSAQQRRRKHVSALRAEIASDASGQRKRIERGATRDRKGREIAVERLTPAGEGTRRREHAARRDDGRRAPAERPRRPNEFEHRQARRDPKREGSPRPEFGPRGPRKRDFDRPGRERRDKRHDEASASSWRSPSAQARHSAPREDDSARPRSARADDRGPRSAGRGPRPPWRSRDGRSPAGGTPKDPRRHPPRPPRKR